MGYTSPSQLNIAGELPEIVVVHETMPPFFRMN